MDMDFTTIFIIAGIVLLAIFVLIVRLTIRWITKLAIVGVILIALAGGGFFWWWTSKLTEQPKQIKPRPGRTRRASSQ